MAMEPAAISARPARTMMCAEETAPERPAARAKGTVRPSERPMTTSRTDSEDSKWDSTCECGMSCMGRVYLIRARRDVTRVAGDELHPEGVARPKLFSRRCASFAEELPSVLAGSSPVA